MASGDTLDILTPLMSEPPATSPAAIDVRNAHPVVSFDSTTDEEAVWSSILPQHYGGGGISIYIHWACNPGGQNSTVRWQTSFEAMAGLDIDADSFASSKSAGSVANATSGIETITQIDHADGSEIDSLVVGGLYRLKLRRDADGTTGTDDAAADAQVLMIELREM